MELRCPRCTSSTLAEHAGSALGDAPCARCRGTFVPTGGVERLVHTELGLEVSTLRELMGPHAATQLSCPSCAYAMSHVQLKGVPLELCTGCGSVWLDDGELERLSLGRYSYVPPAPPDLVPVGTAAEVPLPSEPPARQPLKGRLGRRVGCFGIVAGLYAGSFGLAMLIVGVSMGSWQLAAVGAAALGVVGIVLFAPSGPRRVASPKPADEALLNPPEP